MGRVIKIRGWREQFETAESRKLKRLNWVPMPNAHDGRAFCQIAAHDRAVEILCAWPLMLQVASRMPERGTLADESGAITAEDLARMTRFPAAIFEAAIEFLSKPEIGWIDLAERPSGESAGPSGESAGASGESAGALQKSPDTQHNSTDITRKGKTSPNRSPASPDLDASLLQREEKDEERREIANLLAGFGISPAAAARIALTEGLTLQIVNKLTKIARDKGESPPGYLIELIKQRAWLSDGSHQNNGRSSVAYRQDR